MSRVAASPAPPPGRRFGAGASGTVHAMASDTAEKAAATTNSARNPATAISISPNAGASAWVVSVETPKRPSAAARRVAGAKTTASVDAALNADAKARPCTMRSRYIAGPIACTNRKAAEAAPMVAMPASRKSRQPTRSRTAAMTRTAASPATPLVPITSPMVRSEPPSARMCSGSRKNEAKFRKKKKLAAVTRTKRGVSRRSSAAGAPASAREASIDDAAPCRDRRHIIHGCRRWGPNGSASSGGGANVAASG